LNGLTGMFNIPSGEVLQNDQQTVAIHRLYLTYDYGIFSFIELGLMTDLDGVTTFDELGKTISFNCKVRFIEQKTEFIDLAAGFENSDFFMVASKTIKELEDLDVVLGSGDGRFNYFFAGIAKYIHPIIQMGLEYDGENCDLGFRIYISKHLKLDLFFSNFFQIIEHPYLRDIIANNLYFGVSFTEFLNIELGGIF